MPELPEVELTRRNLERWLEARRVVRAEAENVRTFRGSSPRMFETLQGKVQKVGRRGKYFWLDFESGPSVLMHLGMTGKFVRRPAGVAEPYSRARLVLDDGNVLHFRDPRMFGRIEPLASGRAEELQVVRELGRDPLADGLDAAQLEEALAGSKQELKVALMDQARLTGLGNIHAAEALFRAGLHPARKPASLSADDWKRLARAIDETIRYALESEQSEELQYVEEPGAENPFLIYGRAGEPCRQCGTTVRSATQGGRTTHFCPQCQPLGGTAAPKPPRASPARESRAGRKSSSSPGLATSAKKVRAQPEKRRAPSKKRRAQ